MLGLYACFTFDVDEHKVEGFCMKAHQAIMIVAGRLDHKAGEPKDLIAEGAQQLAH